MRDLYLEHVIGKSGDWFEDVISAKTFREELGQIDDDVRLRINAPGGDTQETEAILSAIDDFRSDGRVFETLVEGIAASAAATIAFHGKPARATEGSLIMIHDPWTITLGNTDDHYSSIDVLDRIGNAIVRRYERRSKLEESAIRDMMKAETYMDASEAVAHGFIDEVAAGSSEAFNCLPSMFANFPAKYRSRIASRGPLADQDRRSRSKLTSGVADREKRRLGLIRARLLTRRSDIR